MDKPHVLLMSKLNERVMRSLDDLYVVHHYYEAADGPAFPRDIAAKPQVFGCKVVCHGRREQADRPYPYDGDPTAMGELMLKNLELHFAGRPVATPVVGG